VSISRSMGSCRVVRRREFRFVLGHWIVIEDAFVESDRAEYCRSWVDLHGRKLSFGEIIPFKME